MPTSVGESHPPATRPTTGVHTMNDSNLTLDELVPFLLGFLVTLLLQVLRYADLYPGGAD